MTKQIKEPEQWPTLEPKEMCIDPYSTGPECGCLLFWTDKVIDNINVSNRFQLRNKIQDTLNDVLGLYITGIRDHKKVSKKQVADGWNEAGRRLGYVVPCDRK